MIENNAPDTGAMIYTHRKSRFPATTAGAIDLAGFMEAPLIGPANMASSKTTEPIASPANKPCSLDPVATFNITSISIKVRMNSRIRDCAMLPAGNVIPNNADAGNNIFNARLAINAPVN